MVVDVGTGSGILAIWSAQASARTMVRFSLDAICRSRIHVLYHAVLPSFMQWLEFESACLFLLLVENCSSASLLL